MKHRLSLAVAALAAGLLSACTGTAPSGPGIHGHASVVSAPAAPAPSGAEPFAGTVAVDRSAAGAPRTVFKAHACAGMEAPAPLGARTVKL